MKKRVFGKYLSRSRKARKALYRSLVRAMVIHGSIKTTKAKAKFVQGQVEKLISISKIGDLSARRRVYAALGNDRKTTDELFTHIAKAFFQVKGGYTRIVALPTRRGDNAQIVRLEWTKDIQKDLSKKSKKDTKVKSKDKKKISK